MVKETRAARTRVVDRGKVLVTASARRFLPVQRPRCAMKEQLMKMKHLVVASALALVPASASLADKAAAKALNDKKAEAKAKAIAEAKEKAKKELEEKAAASKKAAEAKNVKKADAAEEKKAEEELHMKHLGVIERLDQIAKATNNAELATKVASLTTKEDKRHTLAVGG